MATSTLLPVAARRLQGKVALITGGASGIGRCTARLFCGHGAKVVIADVQDDKGHSVCHDIGRDSATFVHCDVSQESDVRSAVDTAVEKHGKLDIMFNNAGTPGGIHPRILDAEKSVFDRTIATNLTGAFLGTKYAAGVMVPAGGGSIIMTASIASVFSGQASYPYTCSKHAVLGLTRAAAAELGRYGIRVNCVSPYLLATPLATSAIGLDSAATEALAVEEANLQGVVLKEDDVADAVLYLASEESRYVSGHNLVVDGGYTVCKSTPLDIGGHK